MTFRLVERASLCGGVSVLLVKQIAGSSSAWHVVELTPVASDDCSIASFLTQYTGQHSESNRWQTFNAEAAARALYDAWKEGGPDA